MHNKISFERLLYKHTESLLNLDITTFCFPPFKKKNLRHSNNRLILRKPQDRFYPHPSPSPQAPNVFISCSKAEQEQPQTLSSKKLFLICLPIAKIKYKNLPLQ